MEEEGSALRSRASMGRRVEERRAIHRMWIGRVVVVAGVEGRQCVRLPSGEE
jgi:hypothetical protein